MCMKGCNNKQLDYMANAKEQFFKSQKLVL